MLADVLKHAANCDDSTVLASAADTINYHLDSFSVIGATTDLFRRISDAYLRLKRQGVASLDLLFSLMELGLQIPSELNTVILLRQDFARMENKSALAVSSPVSDHVPEIFSEADPSLYAKLDQILSPGSGVDEPTWDTVFNVLIKALEFGPGQAKLSRNDTCRYLAQSRRFYPKRFDGMLIRWVCGVLKSSERPSLLIVLSPLIGVGCVTIQAFLTLVTKLSRHDGGDPAIPNMDMLKIDLVELLVAQPPEQGRYFDLVCPIRIVQQDLL
jgi:mediator of RNA polymerase II transcription subunit 12